MKRKKKQSQESKDYRSYLMTSRHNKVPKTDTVVFWYFLVLRKNNIDPLTVTHNHPELGEAGSRIFSEDYEESL
jgi:hypothetical protein